MAQVCVESRKSSLIRLVVKGFDLKEGSHIKIKVFRSFSQ